MGRPELGSIIPVRQLALRGYNIDYLPTAMDESVTLLQKVNMLIEFCNQVGRLSNELLAKWNEVMEWILNEGLEEAVRFVLLEWLESGKLGTIINQTILGSKATIVVSKDAPTKFDDQTFWYEIVREVN